MTHAIWPAGYDVPDNLLSELLNSQLPPVKRVIYSFHYCLNCIASRPGAYCFFASSEERLVITHIFEEGARSATVWYKEDTKHSKYQQEAEQCSV